MKKRILVGSIAGCMVTFLLFDRQLKRANAEREQRRMRMRDPEGTWLEARYPSRPSSFTNQFHQRAYLGAGG